MAVEINVLGNSVLESFGGSLEFTVTLSEPTTEQVSVSYRMLQGTADDSDLQNATTYSEGNGVLTFDPGQVSQTVSVRVRSDTLDEADEHVVFELFNPSANASLAGGVPLLRTSGFILDDDGSPNDLAVFVSNPGMVEGNNGTSFAEFVISLSRPATSEMTFGYNTTDISALAGVDYMARSGTLTFAQNEQMQSVLVPVIGDTLDEAVEAFVLIVSPPESSSHAGATGIARVLDTDTSPLPEISIEGGHVEEGHGRMIRFVVTLSEPADGLITLSYRTLPGVADAQDLNAPLTSAINSGRLAFAPGQTSLTIFVETNSDTQDERDESVIIELFNPSSNAIFAAGAPVLRGTGVILDNDGPASNLALFVSSPVVTEANDGTHVALFDVMLSRPANDLLTMSYATADIDARAGNDYIATSGTIQFAPGQQHQSVAVTVIGDQIAEAAERFALIVTPPIDTDIDTRGAMGKALILDTDLSILPEISIAGGSAVEGDSNDIEFVVSLSEPSPDAISIAFRTLPGTGFGTDLNSRATSFENNGSVTFAPGQTSASIRIETNTDGQDERDESVIVELFAPSPNAVLSGGGNILRATGIILDDDGTGSNAAIFVSNPSVVESDSGETTALFEITLSRPASSPITIDYRTADITAEAGVDYVPQNGTLTFAPGQQALSISVPVIGDSDGEMAELFALIATPSSGTSADLIGATGVATILDTDIGEAPQISVSANHAVEGDIGFIRFVVTLSEASQAPVSMDWSAVPGTAQLADLGVFPTNGTLTFNPGEVTRSIHVQTRSDNADEFDESVILQLTGSSGAVSGSPGEVLYAMGFVLDDDGTSAKHLVTGQTAQLAETGAAFTDYRVLVDMSRPGETSQRFDLSLMAGTASIGDDIMLVDSFVDFAAGQTRAAATIRVFSDAVPESTEFADLVLTAADGTSFDGTTAPIRIEVLDGLPPQIPTEQDDALTGTLSADVVSLGAGNDIFSGMSGDDIIRPGSGDDILDGGYGWDTVSYEDASGGVEVYMKSTGRDVGGGQGSDTFIDIENVIGSDFDDRLVGDAGDNVLTGGLGDDILKGKGGNDRFFGGEGDDRIRGDNGDDILDGGDGSDNIVALGGNDALYGGAGRDFLYGGQGDDTVHGGDGDDAVRGNLGADLLDGGAGEDDLRGGGGDDHLRGGDGDDFLLGENGRDIIDGGAGDDILNGGKGGGNGDNTQDIFVFASAADGGGGYDVIRDFEDGIDLLDLTAFGFTDFDTEVLTLAEDRASGLRIGFGGGDTLFLTDMTLAMFGAEDVILV